jgi:hypothetical protein
MCVLPAHHAMQGDALTPGARAVERGKRQPTWESRAATTTGTIPAPATGMSPVCSAPIAVRGIFHCCIAACWPSRHVSCSQQLSGLARDWPAGHGAHASLLQAEDMLHPLCLQPMPMLGFEADSCMSAAAAAAAATTTGPAPPSEARRRLAPDSTPPWQCSS